MEDYQFTDPQVEITYLRHLLCDVIEQNCIPLIEGKSQHGKLSSGWIRSHAEALRYLGAHRFVIITHDTGPCFRGVHATERPIQDRGQE